jgi:hypothetical protein
MSNVKFKNWFKNQLIVGAYPFINNTNFKKEMYDIIINVSDEFYPKYELSDYFWFPMNEAKKDVGLNSIYGSMVILFGAEMNNDTVYLHCHAGVNRSKVIQACYFYMRTGNQLEVDSNGYVNRLCAMCARGYLPPKAEMEKFLSLLGKYLQSDLQKNEMMGGMLDTIKLETINNF